MLFNWFKMLLLNLGIWLIQKWLKKNDGNNQQAVIISEKEWSFDYYERYKYLV